MFDADRPIQNHAEDRLGRTVFAKYLARCILDNNNTASLTIGLLGSMGVGKTSVINLMIEELNFAASNMLDQEKPIILNFSAWSYSGQDQLIYSFFRRLSSALRQAPQLPNSEKIIHLLELYISFFTHQAVPKMLRPKHPFFTRWFKRNLMTEETFGWESGRDLTLVKAELNELLRRQQHKIIIVIDNIMRLEDREIKQIFQIVKSMGDYENTTYILSLDKDRMIIEKEYLAKIIQLPFEIPTISAQDLQTILFDRLQQLVTMVPEERWDKDYWADVYYAGLQSFFNNVRDINRYINILGFGYQHVKEVVHPVDFFAITAIQVFVPEVYDGIRDNKDLFTDLVEDVYEFSEEKLLEDRSRCDEIIRRSKTFSDERILQILLWLFPRLRKLYEPTILFYHSETVARKNFRICSPDMFDIYFRLSMSLGTIPPGEMRALMDLVCDEEAFTLELMRLNQDDKINKFLDLLDSGSLATIEKENISHVINALIDSADLFPDGLNSAVSFNTPMRVHRILHQLLRQFERQEDRFILLSEAIKRSTNSIYIIVYELSAQNAEHEKEEDTLLPLAYRDFSPEQLERLKKLAVEKIAYWAETKRLVDHPKLLLILYAWQEWGGKAESVQYVKTIVQDDRGLLAFLGAALKEPIEQTIAKLEVRDWSRYLSNIENFIDPKLLEAHAKKIFEESAFETLREKEQLALLIFLDLIKTETVKIIPKTSPN